MLEKQPQRSEMMPDGTFRGGLEENTAFKSILEEEALRVIQEDDQSHFLDEYTGELDENGCLVMVDGGRAYLRPSMYGDGHLRAKYLHAAKDRFVLEAPEEAAKFGITPEAIN